MKLSKVVSYCMTLCHTPNDAEFRVIDNTGIPVAKFQNRDWPLWLENAQVRRWDTSYRMINPEKPNLGMTVEAEVYLE